MGMQTIRVASAPQADDIATFFNCFSPFIIASSPAVIAIKPIMGERRQNSRV